MRILFGLVIGLLAGFAAATWFYGQGGNIIVSGQEVFPRDGVVQAASTSPAAQAPAAQRPSTPPGGRRQVVRDVTDEPPPAVSPPPPAVPAGPPPAAAPSKPVTRYEITSDFVILVPRI